jgi:hypothetical protein
MFIPRYFFSLKLIPFFFTEIKEEIFSHRVHPEQSQPYGAGAEHRE